MIRWTQSQPWSRLLAPLSKAGRRIREGLAMGLGALLLASLSACATPESVVRSAIEAAQEGRGAAYEACFTPRSRPILRTLRRAETALDLHRWTPEEVQIHERPGGKRPWARRTVEVSDGSRVVQLVLRGQAGAWRIDLMDTERRATSAQGRL